MKKKIINQMKIIMHGIMILIMKKYGYYKEGQIAIVHEGADGAEKIRNMMEKISTA